MGIPVLIQEVPDLTLNPLVTFAMMFIFLLACLRGSFYLMTMPNTLCNIAGGLILFFGAGFGIEKLRKLINNDKTKENE